MNVLPDEIPVVDGKLKQLKVLKRRSGSSDRFSEADFDQLIIAQASSISSTLNSARVFDGTTLRLIARQVANIDILFAEVNGDELIRLVFVEDKLFKNPESGRKVLAQILEYASKEISADEVIAKADSETKQWLKLHRDSLERLLLEGDHLLIICGDRINPRLVQIAKPMLDHRAHALRGVELVLLSLAHYESEDTSIVVPNLVGAVTNFERDLRIEVVVRADETKEFRSTVSLEERPRDARAIPIRRQPLEPWTEQRFLARVRSNATDHAWGAGDWAGSLESILRWSESTSQIAVRWCPSNNKRGSFNLVLERPEGELKLIWVNEWYGVGVYREAIATVFGPAVAEKLIVDLARRLDVQVDMSPEEPEPELGDTEKYPDFRIASAREALFEWLRGVRDLRS